MTTLDLSGAAAADAGAGLIGKVKWSIIVPWAVSILLVGTDGYHRFLSVEAARANDAQSIVQLRKDVEDLNRQVIRLVTIVERMESQQNADVLRNGRRTR